MSNTLFTEQTSSTKLDANAKYIQVALPLPLTDTYTYAIPNELSYDEVLFRRVDVDFSGRKLRGYAVAKGEFCNEYEIKEIKKVVDKSEVFSQQMIDFAKWISDYYFSSVGECLAQMIPKGTRQLNFTKMEVDSNSNVTLSDEQQKVYDNITKDISNGNKKIYLYGVTGSGKTEIYVKLIEDTLAQGKSAIFLVPEIVLSYQTLSRLQQRFGSECAIIHSNLTTSARFNEYLRILHGKAHIVIGPRSAILAPVQNLGLIIIDEEHEGCYKSDQNPRLHARTLAQYLAKTHDATIVLGSATPSIESYFYAKNGVFKLYSLNTRYGNAELPDMQIVDMTKNNYMSNLSIEMTQEINKRLQLGQQVVLLQNRRGFSNVIKCNDCDKTIECPNCNIYMTFHKQDGKLVCHHCGHSTFLPNECPQCHSKKLIKIGAGTERIEEEIKRTFPFANIKRMDLDSLRDTQEINNIFEEIQQGKINIIIGTQIIAKGLHFPNIKFVGIINADIMLNIPDYKSSERAFALITQVAGRAGRVGEKGFVMIQTVNPTHYAITSSILNNYETFYNQEISFRNLLTMPPFCRMARLIIRGENEKDVATNMTQISDILKNNNTESNVEILGPTPCQLEKINKNFRYQILLKSKSIKNIQQLLHKSLPDFKIKSKNYLEIDIDPVDLF